MSVTAPAFQSVVATVSSSVSVNLDIDECLSKNTLQFGGKGFFRLKLLNVLPK